MESPLPLPTSSPNLSNEFIEHFEIITKGSINELVISFSVSQKESSHAAKEERVIDFSTLTVVETLYSQDDSYFTEIRSIDIFPEFYLIEFIISHGENLLMLVDSNVRKYKIIECSRSITVSVEDNEKYLLVINCDGYIQIISINGYAFEKEIKEICIDELLEKFEIDDYEEITIANDDLYIDDRKIYNVITGKEYSD